MQLEMIEHTDVAIVVTMTVDEARAAADEIRLGIVSVGRALRDLYEREGWRALGYASWRECAQAEFGFTQSYAYRLLAAAEVERNISPIGENVKIAESVLRPLTKLKPDQQREAWGDAVEASPDGKPTAAIVEKAAVKFAERKPPKARPEPISSARVIENMVEEWLYNKIGENRIPTTDTVLDMLKMQTAEPYKPGSWLEMLSLWLTEMDVTFDADALERAICAVRDKRRVAAKIAQARTVYVEPTAATPDPEEAAAIAEDTYPKLLETPPDLQQRGLIIEEYERNYFRWRGVRGDKEGCIGAGCDTMSDAIEHARTCLRIAEKYSLEQVRWAIAEVAAEREQEEAERVSLNRASARGGILSREWIMDELRHDDPTHPYFASALRAATADDVREALASLAQRAPGEETHVDARLAALKTRLDALEPSPAVVAVKLPTAVADKLREAIGVSPMLFFTEGDLIALRVALAEAVTV